ncbi:RMD1 family protein [Alteromonadaceae bacterium BrNp21-10]|nr:RMD1 family protein [Alteromonadaceae bacterium BrNp21-10]
MNKPALVAEQPYVETLVVGSEVNLTDLANDLIEVENKSRFFDAMHMQYAGGEFFVFDYGVVVLWNMHRKDLVSLLKKVKGQTLDPFSAPEKERFIYEVHDSLSVKMLDDKLYLPNIELKTMLSISHALAQSAKLGQFELVAEETIVKNKPLADALSETGTIPLSRKALSKRRGSLFQTKSDIFLHFNLLDTPEFFWVNPAYEEFYQVVAKYLEITPRVDLLKIKLETIQELFDMLAAEQNHQHSSFLEWIIIILIAVEIVLFFVH